MAKAHKVLHQSKEAMKITCTCMSNKLQVSKRNLATYYLHRYMCINLFWFTKSISQMTKRAWTVRHVQMYSLYMYTVCNQITCTLYVSGSKYPCTCTCTMYQMILNLLHLSVLFGSPSFHEAEKLKSLLKQEENWTFASHFNEQLLQTILTGYNAMLPWQHYYAPHKAVLTWKDCFISATCTCSSKGISDKLSCFFQLYWKHFSIKELLFCKIIHVHVNCMFHHGLYMTIN